MTVNRTVKDYLPITTKQAHPSHPGRTVETNAQRLIRYEAQEIAKQIGIPISQAVGIAQHLAFQAEESRRVAQSRKAKASQLKRERQHDKSKRDTTPIVKTHGPPMQGGASELGKRR